MRAGSTAYHNGLAAEDIAIRLYEAQQGQILETRWKRRSGEIDLIVSLNGLIIFVEVKARKLSSFVMAKINNLLDCQ